MSDERMAGASGAASDAPVAPAGNVAEVPPGGPLCLTGRIRVEVAGEVVADTDDVALCRCGHSRNKPFCDGSHGQRGDRAGRSRRRRLRGQRTAAGARAADGRGVGRREVAGDEGRALPLRRVVDEAVLRWYPQEYRF